MMTSFSYKYENSIAYQTISVFINENCEGAHNINPIVDYAIQSILDTNILSKNEKKMISGVLNTYMCVIHPENMKIMQYTETDIEMEQSLSMVETQISIIPSFEKWNQDNSVHFAMLSKFKEIQSTTGLSTEQFIDSIISGDIKSASGTVKFYKFMDIVKFIGSNILGFIGTNIINELREGRINPTFTNDIWPEIKHIARLKKAYYVYRINILEAKTKKALDEIHSLFIHGVLMFAFTTTTILVQFKILYGYIQTN